ncbi:MAG: DMT family transporter [Oscillospiraceae bacterium]|nr:DMT family transporter [Oscillospiraceae bacterium]
MDNLWILLVFTYALMKGGREGMKKAALKKSGANEILFFYTLFAWILCLPFSKGAFETPGIYIFYSFIKASVCCGAWLCSLLAIKKMSVSLYGIMDLSRVVFSTLLGVVVLGESFTLPKAIGVCVVILGLTLVNLKKSGGNDKMTLGIFITAMMNCFLNAVSGAMDKVLMKDMEAGQLQFWFMLFMVIIYGAVLLIRREKISFKNIKGNYWVLLMSISLTLGDRLLFIANAAPESQVTLMTLIKQSGVIVSILTGRLIFKEKNILYKLMCAAIVITGIIIPFVI